VRTAGLSRFHQEGECVLGNNSHKEITTAVYVSLKYLNIILSITGKLAAAEEK
jgi:hypothetical protein